MKKVLLLAAVTALIATSTAMVHAESYNTTVADDGSGNLFHLGSGNPNGSFAVSDSADRRAKWVCGRMFASATSLPAPTAASDETPV